MFKKDNQIEIKTDTDDKTRDKMPYTSPYLITYGGIKELTHSTVRDIPGGGDGEVDTMPGDNLFYRSH